MPQARCRIFTQYSGVYEKTPETHCISRRSQFHKGLNTFSQIWSSLVLCYIENINKTRNTIFKILKKVHKMSIVNAKCLYLLHIVQINSAICCHPQLHNLYGFRCSHIDVKIERCITCKKGIWDYKTIGFGGIFLRTKGFLLRVYFILPG